MHMNSHRSSYGLPVTRNMPFVTASMPNRQHPRNMTGIYLGLEGNIKPPSGKGPVPPLARGRGVSRIRTPAEERRYKMVEVLRLKEEKRGFSGQPLRKKSGWLERSGTSQRDVSSGRRWGPAKRIDSANVEELIRTNQRQYTHIANSGVTRSENLTGWSEQQVMFSLPNHVIQSASDTELSGLEECYRRVCKGSIETLHSLLPASAAGAPQHRQHTPHQHHHQQHRVHREQSGYSGTGFTVRSYRNPSQAQIVADFPVPKTVGRPQTVPIRRPHVPQPYFFQFHNHSKLVAASTVQLPKVTTVSTEEGVSTGLRIFASPGVGHLSRALQLYPTPVSEPDPHSSHKVSDSPPPPSFCRTFHGTTESQQHQQQHHPVEISMPTSEQAPALSNDTSLPYTPLDRDTNITHHTDVMEGGDTDGGRECQDELLVGQGTLRSSSSGADITVGLEKEDGTADQVEIDEVEAGAGIQLEPIDTESPKGNVRKASIADKLVKTKQSEAIIATLKENAEQRQKDFQKLLNEHAEIVQEIGRTTSSENLISQAEHGERDH